MSTILRHFQFLQMEEGKIINFQQLPMSFGHPQAQSYIMFNNIQQKFEGFKTRKTPVYLE